MPFDSHQKPWSDNPNAPNIPRSIYLEEKAVFAGILVGSILYGTLIVLFFQCMAGLLDSARRRKEGIRWGLVSYTVATFSFATVYTGMNLNVQSVSFIDNREFPGVEGGLPSGPLGYQWLNSQVLCTVPNIMFLLNNWLADGLLLYRCYMVYAMNPWVIAFPCLAYFGSVAMGIMFIYQTAQPNGSVWNTDAVNFGLPYFLLSLPLNILITLMIVVRLVVHSRRTRNATGSLATISKLYRTVATMLIESSALYALSSFLVVGPLIAKSCATNMFLPILAETQAIAPLLIIRRVANQSALTSTSVTAGNTDSVEFGKQGESDDTSGPFPSGYPISLVDSRGKPSGELGVGVETTVNLHRDSMT